MNIEKRKFGSKVILACVISHNMVSNHGIEEIPIYKRDIGTRRKASCTWTLHVRNALGILVLGDAPLR